MQQEDFDRRFLEILSECRFHTDNISNLNILYINYHNTALCNFKYNITDGNIYQFWFHDSPMRELIPMDSINPTTVYVELLHNTIHNLFNQYINIVFT